MVGKASGVSATFICGGAASGRSASGCGPNCSSRFLQRHHEQDHAARQRHHRHRDAVAVEDAAAEERGHQQRRAGEADRRPGDAVRQPVIGALRQPRERADDLRRPGAGARNSSVKICAGASSRAMPAWAATGSADAAEVRARPATTRTDRDLDDHSDHVSSPRLSFISPAPWAAAAQPPDFPGLHLSSRRSSGCPCSRHR